MARFVYNKTGEDPKSWELDPNKLLSPEAELIEKLTGWTFAEWFNKLGAGSVLAVHALLFVLLKRDDPRVAFDGVQFSMDEIDLEYDDDDISNAIHRLELIEHRTPEEQEQLDDLRLQELANSPKEEETPAPVSVNGGNPPSLPT